MSRRKQLMSSRNSYCQGENKMKLKIHQYLKIENHVFNIADFIYK